MTGRRAWVYLGLAVAVLGSVTMAGCGKGGGTGTGPEATQTADPLPDSAYYLDPTLETWIDPETGYDTTREWTIDGGEWPIAVFMSPSQAPQVLVAEREGLLDETFEQFGIDPTVEKIDLPPRAFHALQRSKWPFVYMPLAVFTDYSRSHENQGGAGGLQYVALAGSTAGGGYTLVARDPAIQTVADLAGKTVAQVNSNPVPGTLLAAALRAQGLALGDGSNDVHLARGPGGEQLNEYMDGKYDAVIVLNILKAQVLAQGSHAITDFADVAYMPNYTILCVERSVLEERPEVVEAFLEMHWAANEIAVAEWDTGLKAELMESWNSYFKTQTAPSAAQRIVSDQAAFNAMLGNMYPEPRIDPAFLNDCFVFTEANGLWGWSGDVDVTKLQALERFDAVLVAHGQEPQ